MFVLCTPSIQVHPESGLSETGLAHASLTHHCQTGQKILTSYTAFLSCTRARGGVVFGSLELSLWESEKRVEISEKWVITREQGLKSKDVYCSRGGQSDEGEDEY